MTNQIIKLSAIALMLALVPLSITTAQADPGNATPSGLNGLLFTYSNTCGVSGTDPCKIGTVGPGGGWIFFVDYNDQYPDFTYLEAAPTDAAASEWCNTSTSTPAVAGWDANAVGRGRANTDAILLKCSSGAANTADAYSTGSTVSGDWFLPSEGEMMLMYTNLRQAGVGGVFGNSFYWSSTEDIGATAWALSFKFGTQNFDFKSITLRVRTARAF